MSISINCQCGRNIMVSEELSGLPVRCPNCGRRHLVPVKILEVSSPELIHEQKPVTTPETKLCDACQKVVPIKAKYCPECGRFFGHYPKPPFHQQRPQQQHPKVHPPKREAFPGPFRGGIDNMNKPFNPHNRNQGNQPPHGHQHGNFHHNQCMHHQMPQEVCEQVIKIEKFRGPKPVSGIAKFSFFSAFLGLLIMLIGVVIISAKGSCGVPIPECNLRIGFGMMHVGGIFTFLAALTAIISIFHFHRKRFGLIFLTFLFIFASAMSSGAVMKSHKKAFNCHHKDMIHQMQLEEIIKNSQENKISKHEVQQIIFMLEKELRHLTKDLKEKEIDSGRIITKINEIDNAIKELKKSYESMEQSEIEPFETFNEDLKPGSSDF